MLAHAIEITSILRLEISAFPRIGFQRVGCSGALSESAQRNRAETAFVLNRFLASLGDTGVCEKNAHRNPMNL